MPEQFGDLDAIIPGRTITRIINNAGASAVTHSITFALLASIFGQDPTLAGLKFSW